MLKRILVLLSFALVTAACVTPLDMSADHMSSTMENDTMENDAMVDDAHAGHMMETGDIPFDLQFIDGMIVHHDGAIAMAEEALTQAERPEIQALVQAILASQQAEVAQMQAWRNAWYADAPPTDVMEMDMGPMNVAPDDGTPYDQRFLAAMIPHHEGAVAMAEALLANGERPELKELAQTIIDAQLAEIEQMEAWLAEWYGTPSE